MMNIRDDLTGRKFDNFLVLERANDYVSPKGCRRSQWKCKCLLCDNDNVIIMDTVLKKGTKKSCGCIEDLTNKRFGKLVVLGRNGKNQAGDTIWKCQCDCGNLISVAYNRLTIGNVKSCGCLRKEAARDRFSKFNVYELSGEYGIGWTSNTNKEFYFDLEDYNKIKNYCWYEDISKYGYRSLKARGDDGKIIKMSYLLGCKRYDHKNRNPLDNRKNNLRQSTGQENAQNRSIPSNNTSGFIGVCLEKYSNKWVAYIGTNKKHINLGRFTNKEDAIKARLKAELKYFGGFAPQRHLFEQYGITIQNDLEETE